MRALVIGGSGLLGRALLEEWNGSEVSGVSSRDGDLRSAQDMQKLLAQYAPDCTVLAAAYTDVDGCEKDPQRAHDVNCLGAVNVALAARSVGSRLVFLSSDYVFDGSKGMPYLPADQISPMNAYGRSKAEAEQRIREILPECCIVRTSWLFGASGRCFPNTILDLAQTKKNLSVVNDQRGCPTWNRDLARAIIELVRCDARGIVHATNQGDCSWYEFAGALVSAAGLNNVTITPVSTAEFPRPARRPAYSVLSGASLEAYGIKMRSWRDTLPLYEDERQRHAAARKSTVS